jgi:hypothetical protein
MAIKRHFLWILPIAFPYFDGSYFTVERSSHTPIELGQTHYGAHAVARVYANVHRYWTTIGECTNTINIVLRLMTLPLAKSPLKVR